MSEPEWVYTQRRQRAAVVTAMVVGAIAMVVVLASTLSSGLNVDLGGRQGKPIAMPDPDVVLAREKKQIDARRQRKIERREERARARRRPAQAKKLKAPSQRSAPAPDPTPAATPGPATAQAPAAPQPSPQPSSGGGVDPRFY